MDTGLRVFVSYGHDEYLPFARNVARELALHGHEVWFDEDRLRPGGDWESYIEEGLDWVAEASSRGRVLLIMTPYSVRRPDGYCLNEIAKALDNRIMILPVMLVWTTPPLSIYRLQWLDMTNTFSKHGLTETFASDFDRILSALETCADSGISDSNRLYRVLKPLNFESDMVMNQTWFTGREWVFNAIDRWLNTDDCSRLFWITGVPGIGKTSIAVRLLQRMPEIAAFHICRRGHSEKASPRRAICTIAHQLSTQFPEFKAQIDNINLETIIDEYNDAALFDAIITQPLMHVSSEGRRIAVILIDGLDEASHDGTNALAEFIAAEFDRLPSWVRIIVTSRPDREVTVPLQSFSPWRLDSHTEENDRDIQAYIRQRLEHYASHESFERACETIKRKSEGVFLYTKHVCDEIIAGRLDVGSPDSFPKGLGGVYHRYFTTKFVDRRAYDQYIRPAMELMVARYEPLSEGDLKKYLGWNNFAVKSFVSLMGAFIIRRDDGMLYPFHLSLIDWLCDEDKAGMNFWIDRESGAEQLTSYHLLHDTVSEYSLKYLMRHIVDSAVDKFVPMFCDPAFQMSRKQQFGTPMSFRMFLEDIELYRNTGADMNALFADPGFQSIILDEHIYFFDHDYYKLLRNWGFDKYVATIDRNSVSMNTVCLMICYHYIVYDIKAVVETPLPIVTDEELSQLPPKVLENYRLVYEIKASSYRISGDFENAARYIRIAMRSAELLGRNDFLLVISSVHARIDMHLGHYEVAIERLCKALNEGSDIISGLSLESDLAKIQHIRSGSTLILVEQYLNLGQPHNALPLLDDMAVLYKSPEDYDRYWSRYLYMSALTAIQLGDESMYEDFRELLAPFSLHLSGGRLFYHEMLHDYVHGACSGNRDMLETALANIRVYVTKALERYDLELMSEGVALEKVIMEELGIVSEEKYDILLPFASWIALKTELFRSIKDRYHFAAEMPAR